MEKLAFITSPDYPQTQAHNLWKNRVMNTRDIALQPGPGLLTVRKTVPVFTGATRARITVSALGIAEIYVNGERLSRDELLPLWSDYSHRVMAWTYDLKLSGGRGEDLRIFARVSPGWWSGLISFGQYGYKPAAFACRVELSGPNRTRTVSTMRARMMRS